ATCYDIRFPELTRALVARGAELIVVPTAWAAGLFKEEHWVTLVRARAIENTVWVAAAAQGPDPDSPPTRAPTGAGRTTRVGPQHAGRPEGHRPDRPGAMAAGGRGRPGPRHDRPGKGGPAVPGAPARRRVRPGRPGGRGRPGERGQSGWRAGPARLADPAGLA